MLNFLTNKFAMVKYRFGWIGKRNENGGKLNHGEQPAWQGKEGVGRQCLRFTHQPLCQFEKRYQRRRLHQSSRTHQILQNPRKQNYAPTVKPIIPFVSNFKLHCVNLILLFCHKIHCRLLSIMALLGMLLLLPNNVWILIVLSTRCLMLELSKSLENTNLVVKILFTSYLEVCFVWVWNDEIEHNT